MDPLSPQSQQPAWISASTAEMEVRTRAFIRSVYGWMFGLVLCSIVNIFLRSSCLSFVISIIGVFVFLGLTAWDNQKLKQMAMVTGPAQENVAVIGALALYLDFINLFLFLLRIFGDRRR